VSSDLVFCQRIRVLDHEGAVLSWLSPDRAKSAFDRFRFQAARYEYVFDRRRRVCAIRWIRPSAPDPNTYLESRHKRPLGSGAFKEHLESGTVWSLDQIPRSLKSHFGLRIT
jgi:hypothetical protein